MSRKTSAGIVVSPEQRLSLIDALKMYTRNPAYASFQEGDLGTLELGKLGDLVVLPVGFMEYLEDEVKNANIEMTIVAGKVAYQEKTLVKK